MLSLSTPPIHTSMVWLRSLTPLGAESLAAQKVLIRHCFSQGRLDLAASAWLSELVPAGTLIFRDPETVLLSLGSLGHTACLCWRLHPEVMSDAAPSAKREFWVIGSTLWHSERIGGNFFENCKVI